MMEILNISIDNESNIKRNLEQNKAASPLRRNKLSSSLNHDEISTVRRGIDFVPYTGKRQP